jgi:hypothetical protein
MSDEVMTAVNVLAMALGVEGVGSGLRHLQLE